MKNGTILETLDAMINNPEGINSDLMEQFIQNTLRAFNDLKNDLISEVPEKREKAINSAADLKTALEERVESICNASGMDMNSLAKHFSNPSNFTSKEWDSLSSSQGEIKKYKEEFINALVK